MSVSAHLSPEPERRLWLISESLRQTVDGSDARCAALAALAAAELGLIRPSLPAAVPLLAALACGAFSLIPLERLPKTLAYLERERARPRADDNLLVPEDLTKYTHGELIFRLDKYLGGGITATPYYEDLAGRILEQAHLAARKRRLLKLAGALTCAGQLGLLWALTR